MTSAYRETNCPGSSASKRLSMAFSRRNRGSAVLARISTKFSTAMSAMASVFGLRSSSNRAKTSSRGAPSASSPSSTTQSSNPQFMPWPKNGTIAWAASPSSNARSPACQVEHFTVTIDPVGFPANWASRSGSMGSTSAKCSRKNARTAPGASRVAKLGAPSKARKRVQVKLPSSLGRAMSMKSPRGQMWSAFRSSRQLPSGPAGRDSSL